MAEGYARYLGDGAVRVRSAGIEAHGKNPRAIAVMAEDGVDISRQESTQLAEEMFDWADAVVTVCAHADEQCPALPPGMRKLHWPLEDPAGATGAEEEVMGRYRAVRDDIRRRVAGLLEEFRSG